MILKIVIILSTAFIQLAINLNIAGECIFSEFIGSVPAKGINKWCESSQKKIFNMQKQIQTFKIQIFDLIRAPKKYIKLQSQRFVFMEHISSGFQNVSNVFGM